jgi:hypothetical protein
LVLAARVSSGAPGSVRRQIRPSTADGDSGTRIDAAVRAFEPAFVNDPVVVLEGRFVHRSGSIEKKGGNRSTKAGPVHVADERPWLDGRLQVDRAGSSHVDREVPGRRRIAVRDEGSGRLAAGFFAESERTSLQVVANGRPGTAPYCPNLDRGWLRSTRCGVPCAAGLLTHRNRGR